MLKLWRNVCGVFVPSGNHILVLLLSVSFSSRSSLSFTIHAYLCAVSACYCVPVFLVSCTLLIFYSWSVLFLLFPLQDLSFSSSVVLLPLAHTQPPALFPHIQYIWISFCRKSILKGGKKPFEHQFQQNQNSVQKFLTLQPFLSSFFPLSSSLSLFNFLFCSSLTSQIVTVWWQAGWLK